MPCGLSPQGESLFECEWDGVQIGWAAQILNDSSYVQV